MEQQVGVGVVGCGYWGMNHVRVFTELTQARVVAACDSSESRREEVQRRFPGLRVIASLDELLQDPGLDAVVVCTEASSHYPLVRSSLLAGKHVLVEKPMVTRVAEGEDLVAEAEARQLKLMVGHTFLYNAAVRLIKSYLSQGDTGRVYYLYSRRTNLGPVRHDVNALWDLAPHDVSIFNYLLGGAPEWVSAVGVRALGNGREDAGFVSLGYPDGIVGHIHVSWANPHKERELVVVSSARRIVFDDLDPQGRVRVFAKGLGSAPREAPSYGEFQLLLRDGDILIPNIEPSEPLKNECQHFLDCIVQERRPLTDGLNGLAVVRVMEATDRSLALRGAPVATG